MLLGSRLAHRSRSRFQGGQAMLLVVMLVGLAAALLVYGMVDTTTIALRRDRDTAAAFADVKRALVGWSVQRTSSNALPNARPGELPCPDMNNDGSEDGSCVAGAIGRVPWKSLGIPEPKDDAGETLWYAIAGPFRIWGMNGTVINSDTRGNLTVYQDTMAAAITTEAIAVVFAPGAALGTQNRDPVATALCPTTGTTIARNLCAANYLETAAATNNAATNGPFKSAPGSDAFNDKVMAITTADLMPLIEQRVARELRAALAGYFANSGCGCYPQTSGCGCYPWADISDGTSQDDLNRGRVPTTALPHNWGQNWGGGTIPFLPGRDTGTPGWYVNNDWRRVIYYAVGRNFLEANSGGVKGGACTSCIDPTLTFNGASGTEVVLIMPGPAGVSGAHASWPYDYFEDGENNDHNDDWYLTPSSTAYARDRTYTIP
jgi:hypothetical protein